MRTLLLRSLFAMPVTIDAPTPDEASLAEIGHALEARARRLYGRSLTIREVDAGSCNGCELEIHALNNAIYDVERFGIRFVASPRHADVLLVTGPVTHNMKVALERTYAATPDSEIGGRGRRLRLRLRRVQRQLCGGGLGRTRSCRSTCTSEAVRRGRSICSKGCWRCSSGQAARRRALGSEVHQLARRIALVACAHLWIRHGGERRRVRPTLGAPWPASAARPRARLPSEPGQAPPPAAAGCNNILAPRCSLPRANMPAAPWSRRLRRRSTCRGCGPAQAPHGRWRPHPGLRSRSMTNERSILILSNGKLRRLPSEE